MDKHIIDHVIHRNALRHGLSKVFSETNQDVRLLQYKRLVEACMNGKQDDHANLYCSPCQEYEDDSVVAMLERIYQTVSETSYLLTEYKNLITPKHDN
jgi:hypothetical protein